MTDAFIYDHVRTPRGRGKADGALHEVTPVTRGRRYAFLAFLYGEADAALREQSNDDLHQGETLYRAGHDRLLPERAA